MARLFITLLALAFVIWLVYRGTVSFIAWLGRGKPLRRAVESGELSELATKHVLVLVQLRERQIIESDLSGGRKRHLTRADVHEVMLARARERERFLDHLHLGLYQAVFIFLVASILGLFLEEAWMYATYGLTESRVGLVWGPFSPIYGVGAVLLTWLTFALRKRGAHLWVVFVLSMAIGGGLEQTAGWTMDTLFHAQSWDYTGVPGAITQWVAVPFLVFWGILGSIWSAAIMPELLYRIGAPTTRRQAVLFVLVAVYLAADIFMTFACFDRITARHEGIPPANAFEAWLDTHYTDTWVEDRFQNLTISDG